MEEMLEKKLADAISAGQWQEVKELAGKWAARYGPDPVAGISDEARLAQQAERRKDDVAAKRHWAEARRMAEQIPPKPDEWLIATFLQMAACLWLDELNERSRLADALQQVKGPEGEGLEKRFSEVVRWVEKVRDAFPDSANAWCLLGLARDWAGEFEQALSDYAKAIEIKPDDAEVYLDKALACQEAMEKYPERREEFKRQAINALRKFIELAPKKGLRAYVSDARQMLRELGAE